jgi:hypothetical protein
VTDHSCIDSVELAGVRKGSDNRQMHVCPLGVNACIEGMVVSLVYFRNPSNFLVSSNMG